MALPPTIPTSFVPKQPVTTAPHKRVSGANPFLALAYFILGVTILGCFAVFGYQFYLENVAKKKADAVNVAQQQIDQATVTDFIRLRDRFSAAKDILNEHIVLSQFFDDLEKLTLATVRFKSLTVQVTDDRKALIDMEGTARTFNALAAQSAAFASDKRIKRAIFSNITVKDGGSVEFKLSAELDPSLVLLSAASVQPAPAAPVPTAPAATTSPTATTTP
ncbi:MAG: hypothetical protein ACM3TU_02125 [Bacillota bacterium]